MEIKEVCANCEGYSKCHDGEDYSTDCDGGFVPRKDLVELHKTLDIALRALGRTTCENIELKEKLQKALETLEFIEDLCEDDDILEGYDSYGQWHSLFLSKFISEYKEELR